MKVLVFNLNGRGGMLHYSSQFSNALAKKHELRVVVPSYSETTLYDKNIELWKIPTNPTFGSFIIDSINIFAHIGLLRKIWGFRPDIIQIMDNHPWYFFYPLVGKIIGAKIFVIQHDPFPHSGERKGLFHQVAIWVNAYLRKITDKLIVHGEKMREKVIKNYGLPTERVLSIYHGSFDFSNGEKQKGIKNGDTFLFFGRIVEYKGLDIFLSALKILEKEGFPYHAIIAGEGNMEPYLENLNELNQKNITLENRFIKDEEIPSFFLKSNFVVLPYKDATASGIIPLAYSFSLPVIATDVGVLSDYVKNEETGLLIESPDANLLSLAIKKLLENQVLTRELGENAKKFQDTALSWDGIIDSIFKDFQK